MTIPSTTILPLQSDRIQRGGRDLDRYMRELIFTLQRQYEDMAQAINGDIQNNALVGRNNYTPTISGSTLAGVGTYASPGYQIGWSLRQGLMVDVWFDVRWTAHTGTGDMTLDLPFLSAVSDENPFIAVIAADNITFTDYLIGSVSPDTRNLLIQDVRSATTFNSIAVTNADTTLRGHVRYIGQALERS